MVKRISIWTGELIPVSMCHGLTDVQNARDEVQSIRIEILLEEMTAAMYRGDTALAETVRCIQMRSG